MEEWVRDKEGKRKIKINYGREKIKCRREAYINKGWKRRPKNKW